MSFGKNQVLPCLPGYPLLQPCPQHPCGLSLHTATQWKPRERKKKTLIAEKQRPPFAIVDSGQGTAVLAQALLLREKQPPLMGTQHCGVRVAGWGLPLAQALWRHKTRLAGGTVGRLRVWSVSTRGTGSRKWASARCRGVQELEYWEVKWSLSLSGFCPQGHPCFVGCQSLLTVLLPRQGRDGATFWPVGVLTT